VVFFFFFNYSSHSTETRKERKIDPYLNEKRSHYDQIVNSYLDSRKILGDERDKLKTHLENLQVEINEVTKNIIKYKEKFKEFDIKGKKFEKIEKLELDLAGKLKEIENKKNFLKALEIKEIEKVGYGGKTLDCMIDCYFKIAFVDECQVIAPLTFILSDISTKISMPIRFLLSDNKTTRSKGKKYLMEKSSLLKETCNILRESKFQNF